MYSAHEAGTLVMHWKSGMYMHEEARLGISRPSFIIILILYLLYKHFCNIFTAAAVQLERTAYKEHSSRFRWVSHRSRNVFGLHI